ADPCALSRRCARADRHDSRTGAGNVQYPDCVARVRANGKVARARRDHREPLGNTPRRASHWRSRPRIRSKCLEWRCGAARDAAGRHREAQSRDQCWSRRTPDGGADDRPRQRTDADVAGGVQKAFDRRYRKVGEGDPGGQRQAGMIGRDNRSAFLSRLPFGAKSAMAEILVSDYCDHRPPLLADGRNWSEERPDAATATGVCIFATPKKPPWLTPFGPPPGEKAKKPIPCRFPVNRLYFAGG